MHPNDNQATLDGERKKRMRSLWLWLPGLGLLVMLGVSGRGWLQAAQLNWANLIVNQSWLSVSVAGDAATPLQDGVADGWTPSIWGGGGRAIQALDTAQAHSGRQSAYIRRTNALDYAVFAQRLALPAGHQIDCGLYSRGSEAFLQIVAGDKTIGYAKLPASATWAVTETHFVAVPANSEPAILYIGLGPQGEAWFDDVACHDVANPSANLVTNGGFESDGAPVNPLAWWKAQVSFGYHNPAALAGAEQILANSGRSQATVSRQNALDLLLDRPEQVQARMQTVSTGCVRQDGNAAIWLGLVNSIVAQAGGAAFEHTAQLAQRLMPECPQPYAALGDLYRDKLGYAKAALMFQGAMLRSAPGPQLGEYAFALGDLDVTELGNWDQAIAVLPLAEANPGWEGSLWYYGAAAIDLGQALQATGRCPEAQLAYKRVLDCQACATRWPDARTALAAKPPCGQ